MADSQQHNQNLFLVNIVDDIFVFLALNVTLNYAYSPFMTFNKTIRRLNGFSLIIIVFIVN